MKPSKKTYPQSRLKNLPEARQAQIVEYLEIASIPELVKKVDKDGGKDSSEMSVTRLRPPTILEGVQWLAKDGIITNTSSLSQFRSWFLLRQSMRANEEASLEMARECKSQGWIKTATEERAAAQIFFTRKTVSDQNLKGFAQVERLAVAKDKLTLDQQGLAQQKEQFALEREKFEFNAAKSCLSMLPELKQIAADDSLDQNDKINAIRAKLFATLPA